MGYQVELAGPSRPSLINLRIGAEDLPQVEQALGVHAPVGSRLVSRNGSITVFGLGPDEWLIRTGAAEEEHWLERLEQATAAVFSSVVLVSDAYSVFTITGPHTLDVLAQATGVDVHASVFPSASATRAAFAKVSALIHRIDEQASFDLYFDSALTRYALRWLESAIGSGSAVGPAAPGLPPR